MRLRRWTRSPYVRRAYYGALWAVGLTSLARALQKSGPVLCYHNVVALHDQPGGDRSLHLPADRFEWQMRWLTKHYDVIPLEELVQRLRAGRPLRRAAAVTFDDAYQGVFDHAVPILRALRIPATIFVVTSAPGRRTCFWWDHPSVAEKLTELERQRLLSELKGDGSAILAEFNAGERLDEQMPATRLPADWTTIRAHAGDGIDLGVHSATHRFLPALNDAEIHHEVVESRKALNRATGVLARLFAHPYGHSDARTRRRVCEAGYAAGLGLDPAHTADGTNDVWCLDRLNIPASLSRRAFEAWTTGFHPRGVH
jgi:peptidoglycan/xylan/chitin deacetylase (PgdA/CDA1 family)